MELDNSILMQKQVRDNSEDLQSEFLDLKNWEEQMKRKEQQILNERTGQVLSQKENKLYRLSEARLRRNMQQRTAKHLKNTKRIKSYDYKSWDNFDVDKACKELENEEQSDDSSEEPLSKDELEKNHSEAIEYKQQGNDFVRQKKWDKAIAAYSEAIKIFPYDAIFYANRALCYLKQDNLYSAEADCSSAIQLDKTYVKAYHRRATARLGLKQYNEAMEDIKMVADLEPCNKETEVLLNQVKKKFGNLFMSEKDMCTTNVSDDREKINPKVIDTKEVKNEKSSTNVNSTVRPTTTSVTSVIESKKDQRIPEWLPEKGNVEIVEPIDKPPHLRSKEPLKRIPVQEADLSKSFVSFIKEEIKSTCNKNQHEELSDDYSDNSDNIIKQKENITICKPKENFIESCKEMPSIPINAVQFLINWKKDTSFDFRYKYLKQIPPGSLPKIFKDAMESDIFSDILMILKTEFMKRNKPIFSYLKDLSNINRFRTFIMFINNSEKQDLKLMFSYCNTSEKISEKEITDLQNKYEI